jgi:alkylation response protein AidB-like acyl-CoA dehydrogenase
MSEQPRADFGFGPDEELLRDTARKFLDENLPVDKLRTLVADDPVRVYEEGGRPAWNESLWREIVELGWTGLAVPEANGGIDINMAGIAGLVEEVGRHALPSPLIGTLNATLVLREAECETAAAHLERIADGGTATLAITDERGRWEPEFVGPRASERDDGLVLDGAARFVQDAFKVDAFLVHAELGKGSVLCVVPADAEGLRLDQDHIHDLTRDQATLKLDAVHVRPEQIVSREGVATLRRAWPALLVIAAADLSGIGEWQLQATAEYARTRKQFDRAIGFFQAVKHPIVDCMLAIDRGRSLLYWAASLIDAGDDRALEAARMAKSATSDAGRFTSDRSVQLHGGIGYTWESDVHIFFKRSMHGQAIFGDGVHQRRELANLLIGPIDTGAA